MKLFHLVVSGSVSLFLYLMLGTIWGSAGTLDYAELETYRDRLEKSVKDLQNNKLQLEDDLDRILHDPGRLQQEAHQIGMIGPDEIRVRLPEFMPIQTEAKSIMATKPEPKTAPKALITGIAVSFGLILLYLLTLVDFESNLHGKRRKKNLKGDTWYQGIRVQTASRE